MAIESKLTAGVLATGQNKFGSSLSVTDDGNTLLVGMPQPVLYLNQEPSAGQGAVFVYKKGNAVINGITYNTWPTTQKLTSGDQDYEYFNYGYATATDSTANLVAVGSRYATVSNVKFAGQVAMYTKDANSNLVLSNTVTLQSPAKNDRFGSSVALSSDGNIMIVGAPGTSYTNKSNVGKAHLFFQTSPNVWQEQPVTFDANTDKAANIFFGNSVAMSNSGDVIVVGAPGIDSDNNQNIGGAYVFSYEAKTVFHGDITANVLAVSNITDPANYSIVPGQYVTGTGVTLGTKVVSQLTSTDAGATVKLTGIAGTNTITLTSNVTSISVGYGVTCNTPGIIANTTTVTGIIGNTVSLSTSLVADAIGIPVVFEHTYVSTVASPIDSANNTVIVSDFSNVSLGQFTDQNNATVTKIAFHNITLSGPIIGTPGAVQFFNIGKTGTYEVTPNAITGSNIALNSFGWRTHPVKLKTPKEINQGFFGDSISVSGDGNTIVVGSANGAFVFDNTGTLKTQLVPNGYRDGESFGHSVAINRDGNMVVVAAPDKAVTVVNANEVYNDGRHKFLYEILEKGDANWDSLGITKCTFDIKGTWHSNADGSDYIEVTNLNPANVGRLTANSFIIGANIPEGTTIKTQTDPKDTAKWGSNGTYIVNLPAGGTLPAVSNANASTTIANVKATTISNLANISEGTQFIALANANATTGNGKAISYNIVGTPNAGAVYKFTTTDGWATAQQSRTLVVDGTSTQWNKLGQEVAISNDGNTVFASSTGTELFGRTNEGLVYVFNI